MKLLRKNEAKSFNNIEDLKELLKKQQETYKWVEYQTTDSTYVALEDNPICIPIIRDQLGIAAEVSDDTIAEQMVDTKLALSYPNDSKLSCYPVGPTAYRGILERVGGTCAALSSLKDSRSRYEVSPADKASICNMLTKYAKGNSLLLIGDELVLADLSDDYVKLPFADILDLTESVLNNNFEITSYKSGTVSHETSSAEFQFYDTEIDDKIIETFSSIGIDVSTYNCHIKVMTSDVGLSGVNLYPYIKDSKSSKIISIGTPLKLEHIGSANMDKYLENLTACFASFKETNEHIEQMKAIRISNPADCLYNVGKKIALPEKQLRETMEDFDNEYPYSCLGINVYLKLFDVLDMYISDTEETVSDLRQMQIIENITRICFYSLSKFDMPVIK